MRYLRGRGDLEEPLVADDAGRPVVTPFEEAAASAALDKRMARLSRALLVVGGAVPMAASVGVCEFAYHREGALREYAMIALWVSNALSVAAIARYHRLRAVVLLKDKAIAPRRPFSGRQLALEVCVALLAPYPGLPAQLPNTHGGANWQNFLCYAVCTLRPYHVVRVLREENAIYRHRRGVVRGVAPHPHPRFDGLLAIRMLFKDGGWGTLFALCFLGWVYFGYFIWVAERNEHHVYGANADWHGFSNVLWFCGVTLTTVGYGDMIPETGPGRYLSIICCIFGILLLGVAFSNLSNCLELSDKASFAIAWYKAARAAEDERASAARVLQRHWRFGGVWTGGDEAVHDCRESRRARALRAMDREYATPVMTNARLGAMEDQLGRLERQIALLTKQLGRRGSEPWARVVDRRHDSTAPGAATPEVTSPLV